MIAYRTRRLLQLAVKSVWSHRLRSVLTALGMVFGVGSVVAMLAIGEGASRDAQQQFLPHAIEWVWKGYGEKKGK